jgi:exopolyphosphatase/guanosine-5'-triphosphate,3'-diphosphate pyrophosphatase
MEDKQIFLSPDLSHRLAAIDIGTNSVRLVIAEALRAGNYRILDEEKATTRLGHDLVETGRLDADAVTKTLEALRRMKQIAAGFQVRDVRVIATCAVREADDGEAFVRRVRDEVGLDVETISSDQEGRLAFMSVERNFNLVGKNVAVADIGGGSTEIVLATGSIIEAVCGTPLGAVRITEKFGTAQAVSYEQFEAMVADIDRVLRRHTRKLLLEPHILIGSGGTFTTLAEMTNALKGQPGLPLRGSEVTRAEVRHLLDRLRKIPAEARRSMPGLSPDRADIIVAGITIVDRIMYRFDLNRVMIHDRGVRDGLMLMMIDQMIGRSKDSVSDRESSVERFATSCQVDMPHARQVARLAGLIFSEMVDAGKLDPADRPLLETAAVLQDVGYLINYEKHHKHSYYLILNSRLAGFQPHELEIIANIARYHRGSLPKKKHANFSQLPSKDQTRIKKMAAILRIAGGLDRTNTQQVQSIAVTTDNGDTTIHAIADELPDVDIWSARKRAEAFEKAFDTKLQIEWQSAAQSAAG